MTHQTKIKLLVSLSVLLIFAMFFVAPIPQSSAYHQFADGRTIFNVPNFFNVLSNFPFLVFGTLGILNILQKEKIALWKNRLFFFVGILLTGFGSAYYHWSPCIDTLVWDRLPMVMAFMPFFTLIIGEYVDEKMGEQLLFPMLLIGIASVVYWYWTEMNGVGDLRWYALVQFLPLLLMPIIMLSFERNLGKTTVYLVMIGIYGAAKVFETYDVQVFSVLPISGHSLKHLIGASAAFWLWKQQKNVTV
jgi:hypothetical protein